MGQYLNYKFLKFNKDRKFKIVQFTDIHMKEYNEDKRDEVLKIMTAVLKDERPELVVLTGDIASSENVEEVWSVVTKPMIDSKIPWAVVFGNHDHEHGYSNKEIMEYLLTLPFNYSSLGPQKISGVGNYVLEVKDSEGINTEALLYYLDSNSNTGKEAVEEYGNYDWIKFDQIKWYREVSSKYTNENNEKPYPALAFFHIPLPEYNQVFDFETTIGEKNESVFSPTINSGLYNAFLESKDVMGVFVGHDHVNDYIGCLNGICLAYGCKTGVESYGDLDKGARIIELYEGNRMFSTWLHTLNDSKKYFTTYPDDFED